MPNVLLVATGSVAAIRTGALAEELRKRGHEVRLVHTAAAAHFLDAEKTLPKWLEVYNDAGEWKAWKKLKDPVQHIDLRDWASVLLFAPLDANTLGKLASGICDNLATCVARAWPMGLRPVLVAPAMNSAMWYHPITATQLNVLRGWGVRVIDPVVKKLACGETGMGGMASRERIVREVESMLSASNEVREKLK